MTALKSLLCISCLCMMFSSAHTYMLSEAEGSHLIQATHTLGRLAVEDITQIMHMPFKEMERAGLVWSWNILSQPHYELTDRQYYDASTLEPNLSYRRLSHFWTPEQKEKVEKARLNYFTDILQNATQTTLDSAYWGALLKNGGSLILKAILIAMNQAFHLNGAQMQLTDKGRAIDGHFDTIVPTLHTLEHQIYQLQTQNILSHRIEGIGIDDIRAEIVSSRKGSWGNAIKTGAHIQKIGEANFRESLLPQAPYEDFSPEMMDNQAENPLFSEAACLCGHLYGLWLLCNQIDRENRQKSERGVGAAASFLTEICGAIARFKKEAGTQRADAESRSLLIHHTAPIVYARMIPILHSFREPVAS